MTTIDQIAQKLQKAIASQQPTITTTANELKLEQNGTSARIPQIPQGMTSRRSGFR